MSAGQSQQRDAIDPTVQRLFDDGYEVELFKNRLTSFTAVAKFRNKQVAITDHFTPTEALRAIAEKVYGVGAFA